jgi:uncharacterized membrane protein YphA (DoxX/SURF4 family)
MDCPWAAMYFERMRNGVFLLVFGLSLVLAVVNNWINPDGVPWLGSPQVLEKPGDWPTLTMGQGIAAGAMVAWKYLLKNLAVIGGILAAILAIAAFLAMKRKTSPQPWLLSVLRVFLAWMFLLAAYPKFTHPQEFSTLVAQYQFLPPMLVHLFSLWLPAFEIVVGLGLLFVPYEKEMGALVMLMLGMFIIALAQALGRDLGIACGCFDIEGAADAGETWFSLLRDIVLIVPVTWMMVAGRKRWLWQLS